jgi:phosphodiesterase/alkaline phosphatase D-like protein
MNTTFTISPTILLGIALMILPASLLNAQTGNNQLLQITNGPIIESADDHSATIAWSTNAPSSSRVWYGTDVNNLTQFAESGYSSGSTHRVQLNNLRPGTTYYFEVESGQGRRTRGEAESEGVLSFRTPTRGEQIIRNQRPVLAQADAGAAADATVKITNGPVLEAVTGNTATVAWSTNRRGSSRVNYGTDPNNLTQLAEAPWGRGGLTHRVELKNLQPNTTYYFRVETGQAQGTGGQVESQNVQSFTTKPH